MRWMALVLAFVGFVVGIPQKEVSADVLYLGTGNLVLALDTNFKQQSAFFLPAGSGDILGITSGPGGQVFVTTRNFLFDFSSTGAVLNTADLGGSGGDVSFVPQSSPSLIPEPSAITLVGSGILGLLALGWIQKDKGRGRFLPGPAHEKFQAELYARLTNCKSLPALEKDRFQTEARAC